MTIITKTGFDSGDENYTFSLWKQEYLIKDDGSETPIGAIHRMAVTPLDMELVKDFVGQNPKARVNHPIIKALSNIWTKDVIHRYKEVTKAAMVELEQVEIEQVEIEQEQPEQTEQEETP